MSPLSDVMITLTFRVNTLCSEKATNTVSWPFYGHSMFAREKSIDPVVNGGFNRKLLYLAISSFPCPSITSLVFRYRHPSPALLWPPPPPHRHDSSTHTRLFHSFRLRERVHTHRKCRDHNNGTQMSRSLRKCNAHSIPSPCPPPLPRKGCCTLPSSPPPRPMFHHFIHLKNLFNLIKC